MKTLAIKALVAVIMPCMPLVFASAKADNHPIGADEGSILSRIHSLLLETDMPIWLSLVLAALAGLGTYFLAPKITKKIELDKARAAHILQAIQKVNEDVVKLNQAIRQLISSFVDKPSEVGVYRGKAIDCIAEVHWRLIDLKVIFHEENDLRRIDRVGTALDEVREEVAQLSIERGQESLLSNVGVASDELKGLLSRLYERAQLKR
jgi:hypothetical protein